MSCHFNAGQFNKPFLPKHLGNWEIPRWYPRKPRTVLPKPTVPIAESNGRLLPKVHRAGLPWGYRRTAWDYPSRITRQLADELSKEPQTKQYLNWDPKPNDKLPADDTLGVDKFKEEEIEDKEKTDDEVDLNIEALDLEKLDENLDMVRTSPKSRPISQIQYKTLPIIDPFSGFHYARKMHMDNLLHHPLPDTMGSKDTHVHHIPGRDLCVKPYSKPWKSTSQLNERPLTSTNKITPKPITDTNRPATSAGEKENIVHHLSPMDLAICWDFRAMDPRDEPKRPKHIDGSNGSKAPAVFSMVHSPKQNTLQIPETGRSNAIFSQNILPADLEEDRILPSFEKDMSKEKNKEACDVPKCSQHACYEKKSHRGKNGKSPKKNDKTPCDGIHGCGTISQSSIASQTLPKKFNHKIKNAWEEKENHSPHSAKLRRDELSKAGSLDHLNNNSIHSPIEPCKLNKSSPNISKRSKDDDSSCSSKNKTKSVSSRSCKACQEDKKINPVNKEEYKQAFKAGKPNSTTSNDISTSNTTTTKNSVKVPKMRDPYSKKSYTIPTLTPPFSRWNDTSGYPEHWRLMSVYQHAYKTPGPKRRPLLPAVYQ